MLSIAIGPDLCHTAAEESGNRVTDKEAPTDNEIRDGNGMEEACMEEEDPFGVGGGMDNEEKLTSPMGGRSCGSVSHSHSQELSHSGNGKGASPQSATFQHNATDLRHAAGGAAGNGALDEQAKTGKLNPARNT